MMHRTFFIVVVLVILFVAVLGMPLMLSGHSHHALCPFLSDIPATCPFSTLVHIEHWQSAFASIFLELLALGVLILVLILWRARAPVHRKHIRWRSLSHIPDRPTLMEELFRKGILNRKEPSLFFAHISR